MSKRLLGAVRRRIPFSRLRSRAASASDVAAYWTRHNVTGHHNSRTAEESLDYFDWRNDQYYGYLDLMPVRGADDRVVLDFGCGPGHDLVGFAHHSKPRALIAAEVSASSLAEAESRLKLHGTAARFVLLDPTTARLPFEDRSIDLIHSSGVLHHVPDLPAVLKEFLRILRPDGEARVMVYNYNSLWLHLHVAFLQQIQQRAYAGLPVREAFRHCTDGADCPISNAFTPDEFAGIGEAAGFAVEHRGNAISVFEMSLLPRRFDAIAHRDLPAEHRRFLAGLTFDSHGFPLREGQVAGVDACYRLRHADAKPDI